MGKLPPSARRLVSGDQHYRLCPRCGRSVLATSPERYCIHDGTWLLCHCPLCGAAITHPATRFCAGCGLELSDLEGRAAP